MSAEKDKLSSQKNGCYSFSVETCRSPIKNELARLTKLESWKKAWKDRYAMGALNTPTPRHLTFIIRTNKSFWIIFKKLRQNAL